MIMTTKGEEEYIEGGYSHKCSPACRANPRPPPTKTLFNLKSKEPQMFADNFESLASEENNQLPLEKLEIAPRKESIKLTNQKNRSLSPQMTNSPTEHFSSALWKDYPFVNHCGSVAGTLSQKSYSIAGSNNGLPIISTKPVLKFNGPNFNNYRSSAVADIFGGRSKSKSPLICPAKLSASPIFPNFAPASTNLRYGLYYQSSAAADIWNLMENPISRSSSQSSGFISQNEQFLNDGSGTPRTASPSVHNFQNLIYPQSPASVYSQGHLSVTSNSNLTRQHQQQVWIGPNQNYRNSYPRPTDNFSKFVNRSVDCVGSTKSTASAAPTATCSRFGPRSSSFLQKSMNEETEIFSDADDCEETKSFKTARGESMYSHYSSSLRKRLGKSSQMRKISELPEKVVNKCKSDPSIGRILYQLFCSVIIFLAIITMFWLIFGSGAGQIEFFDVKNLDVSQYFKWFWHVSHNLTHCVRDNVFSF